MLRLGEKMGMWLLRWHKPFAKKGKYLWRTQRIQIEVLPSLSMHSSKMSAPYIEK